MRRSIFLAIALGAVLCGCSKSPIERLKACHFNNDGKAVGCQDGDIAFWNSEAEKKSVLFEEAVKYCRERNTDLYNPICGTVILPESVPVLKYGDHPLPD